MNKQFATDFPHLKIDPDSTLGDLTAIDAFLSCIGFDDSQPTQGVKKVVEDRAGDLARAIARERGVPVANLHLRIELEFTDDGRCAATITYT